MYFIYPSLIICYNILFVILCYFLIVWMCMNEISKILFKLLGLNDVMWGYEDQIFWLYLLNERSYK